MVMRDTFYIALVLFSSLLAGCAAGTSSTRARTSTVPAGPVTTASASTNVIPAQTTLVIRANETIEATSAAQSRQFDAEVAQDIVNANGQVIVPKGSPVTLTVLDASGGGAVGTSELELALSSVTINGQRHQVHTEVLEERGRAGIGANERTAQHVGGGAALGALIGAVAGGGSGAAAGAAVGAAAGGAAQVLTRGDNVRVPAETVLTFKLDRPIQLK